MQKNTSMVKEKTKVTTVTVDREPYHKLIHGFIRSNHSGFFVQALINLIKKYYIQERLSIFTGIDSFFMHLSCPGYNNILYHRSNYIFSNIGNPFIHTKRLKFPIEIEKLQLGEEMKNIFFTYSAKGGFKAYRTSFKGELELVDSSKFIQCLQPKEIVLEASADDRHTVIQTSGCRGNIFVKGENLSGEFENLGVDFGGRGKKVSEWARLPFFEQKRVLKFCLLPSRLFCVVKEENGDQIYGAGLNNKGQLGIGSDVGSQYAFSPVLFEKHSQIKAGNYTVKKITGSYEKTLVVVFLKCKKYILSYVGASASILDSLLRPQTNEKSQKQNLVLTSFRDMDIPIDREIHRVNVHNVCCDKVVLVLSSEKEKSFGPKKVVVGFMNFTASKIKNNKKINNEFDNIDAIYDVISNHCDSKTIVTMKKEDKYTELTVKREKTNVKHRIEKVCPVFRLNNTAVG